MRHFVSSRILKSWDLYYKKTKYQEIITADVRDD